MHIKRVNLINFRNYSQISLDLYPGLNILIGENAQGKTNFLEAIELLSTGQSSRTSLEPEFIKHGEHKMHIEMLFEARAVEEKLGLSISDTGDKKRAIFVNGVSYSLLKKLRGRLTTVIFNTYDLNLLRGGPVYRRDWIDSVIVRLKPSFYEQLSKYQKIVQQRNRLLKDLFENNSAGTDQLDIWNEQVARYGASIVRWRKQILHDLLPKAKKYLELISDQNESLSLLYRCQSLRNGISSTNNYYDQELQSLNYEDELAQQEQSIAENLLYSLKHRQAEEIARRQTLSGPHRDDLVFLLNDKEAVSFASQGQQRSIVLALKLSELELIKERLSEPPVLLLDDVLAELDLKRQALLMSQITEDMQTIISTTHVSNFNTTWLNTAHFYEVKSGTIITTNYQAVVR